MALAARKNLSWMATVANEPQGVIEALFASVSALYEERRRLREPQKIAQARPLAGLTMFDVGLARKICRDVSTTAGSRRLGGPHHGDEAASLSGSRLGYRGLYLDMIKRSLTNYP